MTRSRSSSPAPDVFPIYLFVYSFIYFLRLPRHRRRRHRLRLEKTRVRSGYGKSGKSMEFVFSISRPGKSMEICEKLWKFQKKVWNFVFYLRENFEDRKCAERSEAAAERLTESSSSAVPSFHVCSYSSYNCVGRALSCLPAASKKKRHARARNSSFVEKRSLASQAVGPILD